MSVPPSCWSSNGSIPQSLGAWTYAWYSQNGNDRVIFDRFESYWDLAAHKNMPKTVIIQFVDDLNTRLLMLKSGQADEIYVNIRDLDTVRPQIQAFSNIVPVQSLIVRQFALMFDIDPASGECPKDSSGAAACDFFSDKNIRKTFSYAFNYDQFVNDILHGRAARLHGVVPAGLPGHDGKLSTGYDYDVQKAKDALADETVAMGSMLGTLKREAEALSQNRHAITVEDSARVDLWGSTKELHSAFSNLVSNAVRYTPAGGSIAIVFAREGDGVALSVRDSGYGIPTAHLPRITERFYRVSTSRSRESGGTGLGLAIVKHVLGLHQARLEIVSAVGRGSTFSCHFGADRVHPRGDTLQVAHA